MQVTILPGLLLALATLTGANPVPSSAADVPAAPNTIALPANFKVETLPITNITAYREAVTLLKRRPDACFGSQHRRPYFQVSDIRGLQGWFYNNGFAVNEFMGAVSVKSWTWGDAKYCIFNWYGTQNTHISHNQIATNVQYITDTCWARGSSAGVL
jgi:hypothetical protein